MLLQFENLDAVDGKPLKGLASLESKELTKKLKTLDPLRLAIIITLLVDIFLVILSASLSGVPTYASGAEASTWIASYSDHIVINEVEVNAGKFAGFISYEFIELYNPTQNAVNMSGWTLIIMNGTRESDRTSFYGVAYYSFAPRQYYCLLWLRLDDNWAWVILRDASGREIDRTPMLNDTYGDRRSWQRYPNGVDTDSDTDWGFFPSTIYAPNIKPTGTIPSTITCTVSAHEIIFGTDITVSGAIYPLHGNVTVVINYMFVPIMGSPSSILGFATTNATGYYSHSWAPNATGPWNVTASWGGDETHMGATSRTESFGVTLSEKPPFPLWWWWPCAIATAIYGSELSPEVQYLRAFRVQLALSSLAGSEFVRVFNIWYYSFSQGVASFMTQHPFAKMAMTPFVYPLLGTLHLSAATYSLFSFNKEVAAIMTALVASCLLGASYYSPLVAVPLLISKRLRNAFKMDRVRLLSVPWVVNLVLILFGEVCFSPIVMRIATDMFVLTTLTFSATVVAMGIVRVCSKWGKVKHQLLKKKRSFKNMVS